MKQGMAQRSVQPAETRSNDHRQAGVVGGTLLYSVNEVSDFFSWRDWMCRLLTHSAFGWLVFSEPPKPGKLLGAVLVVFGVYLVAVTA
jgi:drug/metabolite transporter (DMT)-like permease